MPAPLLAAFIEAALMRRLEDAAKTQIPETAGMALKPRVVMATEWLRNEVVRNISSPVTKGGGRITDRSVPGGYPKADTTMLMKSIFSGVTEENGQINGFVGTPMDYGVTLEQQLDRSFLKRTIEESTGQLTRILHGN